MLSDPILEAWLVALDGAATRQPHLAPWFADRYTMIDAAELVEGWKFVAGDELVRQGDSDREAWVLAQGAVRLDRIDANGERAEIRRVEAPAILGAFGFAIGTERGATAVAEGDVIALKLTREVLAEIAKRSTEVAIGLLRWMAADIAGWLHQSRGRSDTWSGTAGDDRHFEVLPPGRRRLTGGSAHYAQGIAWLSAVRCFQGDSPAALADGLDDRVQLVAVDQGAALLSDGDADRSLLVLLDGAAAVRTTGGRVLARFTGRARLSSEVLIGELGFLTGAPRDGTVVAETDCVLLEIPPTALPWLVQRHPQLAFRIHVALLRTVCWRLREADIERDRARRILTGDLDAWFEGP